MASCLYQETRLNLDPALPPVELLVPSNNNSASAFASRESPKRRRVERPSQAHDEEAFSGSLATESSIHFRPRTYDTRKPPAPRAVLWRLLEHRSLLELQAVELSQDRAEKNEPVLTLRLGFPDDIKPTGVAFAEEDTQGDAAALVVFVLTVIGELYTLTLKKEAFVPPGALKERSDWCKSCTPSALGYRTPVRLVARSAREVWVALGDGGMVRLERGQADNGSRWRESTFTENGWTVSMRGLLPWKGHHTIRYNDVDLEPSTAAAIAISPDGNHVWTVCLNHTLKAWNVASGKVTITVDLAGDSSRDLQKPADYFIDPAQFQLLQILPAKAANEYVVAVFSPRTNQFKLWMVRDADSPSHGFVDARPDVQLTPRIEDLADASVWTLESFHFKPPQQKLGLAWDLWLLVRTGSQCHVYTCAFNLDGHAASLARAWNNNWAQVNSGSNTIEELKLILENPSDTDPRAAQIDPVSAMEKWDAFLFYPGRFTAVTLETALVIYRRSLGRNAKHSMIDHAGESFQKKEKHLRQQVCETIGSSVMLGRGANDTVAYERYQNDVASQWQIYYGVVKDLHKRRGQILSLAFDPEEELAWIIMTDQISPVRQCSLSEVLWHNRENFAQLEVLRPEQMLLQALSKPEDATVGQLFNAISTFRNMLPKYFLSSFKSILQPYILGDVGHDVQQRIQSIYDASGMADQIGEEDYNKLTAAVNAFGGWPKLNNQIFDRALVLLRETQRGHVQNKHLTRYGARMLMRGAQETLQLGRDILMDMLLFVVFVGADLEDDEELFKDFDSAEAFVAIMQSAKECDMLDWMASTFRQSTTPSDGLSILEAKSTGASDMTVLESLFLGDWESMKFPDGSRAILITYGCRAWTFGSELLEQYNFIAPNVMGTFIKSGDLDLAVEFLKFLPRTPWAIYMKGRLCLARSEYAEASIYFKQAALGLVGAYFELEKYDTARLLAVHEREHFKHDLPEYYQHVIGLFENAKVMSYVADFARLALEKLGTQDTPLRSDILSCLFGASIHLCRFKEAFSTLTQHTDLTLRKSALQSLLTTLLSQTPSQVPFLLSILFPPDLVLDVDAFLASLCGGKTSLPSSTIAKLLSPHEGQEQAKPAPHKILYAWRVKHNDFRGAATCLWDRLQALKTSTQQWDDDDDDDGREEEIAQLYLALINVLSLVDPEQAWMLTRPLPTTRANAKEGLGKLGRRPLEVVEERPKRKVVTLEDVRSMWQEEMDRVADVEAGRFPFGEGMQVDGMGGGGTVQVDVFAG